MSPAPSPQRPLLGRCLCGAVRFEVRAPFTSAAYCYCRRCQRRTGTARAASARIDIEILAWVSSAAAWEDIPDDGLPRYEGNRL